MFKADNSIHAFVGSAYDKTKKIADSVVGSIVILDKNGVALNAAAAIPTGTLIQVGQKDASGNVRLSPLVEFAGATGLAYDVAVPQKQTLDLCDDTANTRYTLRLNFKHNVELFSEQSDLYFFEYTTGDVVVAGEVMANFVAQINAAGGTKDKVTAAAVGDDGMTIIGKPQTWALGLHANTVVSFDCTITGFVAAATNVVTDAPYKGSGDGEQVAELEWFAVGSAGAPYRNNVMPSNQDLISLQAVSSASYDVASLNCVIPGPAHAVAGSGAGRCQIVVAMPIASTGTDMDANLGLSSVFV